MGSFSVSLLKLSHYLNQVTYFKLIFLSCAPISNSGDWHKIGALKIPWNSMEFHGTLSAPILCKWEFPIHCAYFLCILTTIFLESISKGVIDNKPLSFVMVLAWRRTVVKSLTKANMSRFIDACIDGLVQYCSIQVLTHWRYCSLEPLHRCVPPSPSNS